jgi:hypothetical protein
MGRGARAKRMMGGYQLEAAAIPRLGVPEIRERCEPGITTSLHVEHIAESTNEGPPELFIINKIMVDSVRHSPPHQSGSSGLAYIQRATEEPEIEMRMR